jgi:hypothetical protein
MRLALIDMKDIEDRTNWESERKKMLVKSAYALRVFIHQVQF